MSNSQKKFILRNYSSDFAQKMCDEFEISDVNTANDKLNSLLRQLNGKSNITLFKSEDDYQNLARPTQAQYRVITLTGGTKVYFHAQRLEKEDIDGLFNLTDLKSGNYSEGSSRQDPLNPDSTQNGPDLRELENQKKRSVLQKIFFGAPGTGKTWTINELLKSEITYRTTFHPDTDYATFVGCYKPSMNNHDIIYRFSPQVFLIAYLRAWREYLSPNLSADGESEQTDNKMVRKHVYLIIEEINRGNCAQIFGDIFQLLDRNKKGFSSYPIIPDQDISVFIKDFCEKVSGFLDKYNETINDINGTVLTDDNSFSDNGFGADNSTTYQIKLAFPPNFHIWATMNTSDQSLYPMDSAFKRRWDWEYVKIDTAKLKNVFLQVNSQSFNWPLVIDRINERIKEMLHSGDKQIGEFFIKIEDRELIDFELFRDKVLFYLYNDVFKDNKKFGDEFFQAEDKYLFEDLLAMKDLEQQKTVSSWFKSFLGLEPISGSGTDENQIQQDEDEAQNETNNSSNQSDLETDKIQSTVAIQSVSLQTEETENS